MNDKLVGLKLTIGLEGGTGAGGCGLVVWVTAIICVNIWVNLRDIVLPSHGTEGEGGGEGGWPLGISVVRLAEAF